MMTAEGLYKRHSDVDAIAVASASPGDTAAGASDTNHDRDEREDDDMLGACSAAWLHSRAHRFVYLRRVSRLQCMHHPSQQQAVHDSTACWSAQERSVCSQPSGELRVAAHAAERCRVSCRHEPRRPVRLDAVRARAAAAHGADGGQARLHPTSARGRGGRDVAAQNDADAEAAATVRARRGRIARHVRGGGGEQGSHGKHLLGGVRGYRCARQPSVAAGRGALRACHATHALGALCPCAERGCRAAGRAGRRSAQGAAAARSTPSRTAWRGRRRPIRRRQPAALIRAWRCGVARGGVGVSVCAVAHWVTVEVLVRVRAGCTRSLPCHGSVS